jgi:extracellular factor (EF) 3-hydroxypalmitic acid methyl ester biosynthesis protein
VDIDKDALKLAQERCKWAASIEIYCGDAIRALRALKFGFDRIVFGGIFDYLDDRSIVICLRLAVKLSRAGGLIAFTNVTDFASFNVWGAHLARWKLIMRSKEDVLRLVVAAGIDSSQLTVQRDQTGISMLCSVRV